LGRSPLSKIIIAISALFGAVFGMTFAQRRGSELRDKMRKARKKGHSPLEPLIEDIGGAGREVADEISDFGESDTVQNLKTKLEKEGHDIEKKVKKKVNKTVKKAKSHAKKRVNKAKREGKKKLADLKKQGKKSFKKIKNDLGDTLGDVIDKAKDFLE